MLTVLLNLGSFLDHGSIWDQKNILPTFTIEPGDIPLFHDREIIIFVHSIA